MLAPPREYLLKSQLFFAILSGLAWIPCAIVAFAFWPYVPIGGTFVFAFGIFALWISIFWWKDFHGRKLAKRICISGVVLWIIPFGVSLLASCGLLFDILRQQSYSFNDVDMLPSDFIVFPLIAGVWFGIPLAQSILLIHQQTKRAEQCDAPNGYPRHASCESLRS